MKETDVHRPGGVANCYVEDGTAAAMEANGSSSAAGYLGENRLDLARDHFGDSGEAEAVFVTEGEITEQVAHGDDAAIFQSGGALRAYAVEVFDRVG